MLFNLNTWAHFGEKLGCQIVDAIVPDCWKCSSVAVEGMCGVELSTTLAMAWKPQWVPSISNTKSISKCLLVQGEPMCSDG